MSGYEGKAKDGVSGFNDPNKNTFVHIFIINSNEHELEDRVLSVTPQPCYSDRLSASSSWQRVCLLDASHFILCCDDTIELHRIQHGCIKKRNFTGEASCVAHTHERIYVGLFSRLVVVFDMNLDQINTITLKGLDVGGDCPWDMAAHNGKLFITTHWSKAFVFNSNGDTEQEYKRPNQKYVLAWSITVSVRNGLLYILWGDNNYLGKRVVFVYSLCGINSSLCVVHFLASFYVPDGSCRIRINDKVQKLFVVTWDTERVYEYETVSAPKLCQMLKLIPWE